MNMKKSLPWAISASLFIALLVSWNARNNEKPPKIEQPDFLQFVPWVPKCEDPWFSQQQMLQEYMKDSLHAKKNPVMYNIRVVSSRDRGNKLMAYKKPDSAWVVLDASGAVDYLASLLWKIKHENVQLKADSLLNLLYQERQKNK